MRVEPQLAACVLGDAAHEGVDDRGGAALWSGKAGNVYVQQDRGQGSSSSSSSSSSLLLLLLLLL